MNNQPQSNWEREPLTAAEFFFIVGIPISFVIVASTILFVMVIRAGG